MAAKNRTYFDFKQNPENPGTCYFGGFVRLFGGFRPTRVFFTHIETFVIAGEGLQIFT